MTLDENLAIDHFHTDVRVLLDEPPMLFEKHPAADVDQAVFLETDMKTVYVREHLVNDLRYRLVLIRRLFFLDKPRVFGKPARVKKERQIMAVGDCADTFDVFHRHGLSAARVICDRHIDERDPVPHRLEERFERLYIHVSPERKILVTGEVLRAGEV